MNLALGLIPRVLSNDPIFIAPAVERELRPGLTHGKTQIERVFRAIQSNAIQILTFSEVVTHSCGCLYT